jgi:cytochrome c biogenesis protein CcmG/thiol:disulfide interchange protein DsbE
MMYTINRIKNIIPFVILFGLLFLLWHELFYSKPNELPSALIGEPIPDFKLPRLDNPNLYLTSDELHGRPALLNIWATWCYACGVESEMLMKIKNIYQIPIYGIAYKDNADDVKNWLAKKGNPYVMTGMDTKGDAAIDLGVYGTPETFIISPSGKIVYRHVGVIDQKSWDQVIYPILRKYHA